MSAVTSRDLLRHALATLAYRAGKTLRGAPRSFGSFTVGPASRTPVEIVGHVADLMDWGLAMAEGEHRWSDTRSEDWDEQVARFFDSLAAFDAFLASDRALGNPAEKLFQGPIADALTHVGQIAMLRRLASSPVLGENYFKATIEIGRIGRDQAEPGYEFE